VFILLGAALIALPIVNGKKVSEHQTG
jgi:hypothetical protein